MQPRTQEVLNALGVLDDVYKNSMSVHSKRRRIYEMPGAVKVAKEVPLAPEMPPTPDRPWVSTVHPMGQSYTNSVHIAYGPRHGSGPFRGTPL